MCASTRGCQNPLFIQSQRPVKQTLSRLPESLLGGADFYTHQWYNYPQIIAMPLQRRLFQVPTKNKELLLKETAGFTTLMKNNAKPPHEEMQDKHQVKGFKGEGL